MIKQAFLPLSVLLLVLAACGDNIHPESDSVGDDDGECFENCPSDVDQPDAGASTPDGGDTGGGSDGGTGGGSDGGTGGGSDGGTGGGSDGGTPPECTVDADCPEGKACEGGACVCDQGGDPTEGGCAPDEVQLCHVPPGNPEASHGICVGSSAAQAHLNHGDALGPCS